MVRCVERVATAWRGELDPPVRADAEEAGPQGPGGCGPPGARHFDTDVDEQDQPPASGAAGRALSDRGAARAGVPPVVRDSFAEEVFPDDVYDLAPASFADVDPGLAEPGIEWGRPRPTWC